MSRALVCKVGGPLRDTENRKAWLARVSRQISKTFGISCRMVRSIYYGEVPSDHWAVKLLERAAQERKEGKAKDEVSELRDRIAVLELRLNALDPDFHCPDVAGLRAAAHQPRDQDGAVDSLTRQAIDYLDSRINQR